MASQKKKGNGKKEKNFYVDFCKKCLPEVEVNLVYITAMTNHPIWEGRA